MTILKLLTISLLLVLSSVINAAEIAGKVIIAKGQVVASIEGETRTLRRRSDIFSGDVIQTGPNSSVQVRFIDKALMTIKANSQMNIERYLQSSADGESEQVLMELVKGGFRTITGSIGQSNKEAYQVNTPAASIGIRGTNYEVQQEADDSFVMGVYSGGIQVENEAGSIQLGMGADFNYTRVKPNTPPQGLLAPPESLGMNTATEQSEEDDDENQEDGSGDENSDDSETGNDDSSNEDDSGDSTDDTAGSEDNTDGESTNYANFNLSENEANDVISDVQEQVNKALDTQLTEKVNQDAEEIIAAGFNFNDPYALVSTADIDNPFNSEVVSDQALALGLSGQLAFMAMPVNYGGNGFDYESASLSTAQVALISPSTIDNFQGYDYSSDPTEVFFRFTTINTTDSSKTEYEVILPINVNISNEGMLETTLFNLFAESELTYFKNGVENIGLLTDENIYIYVMLDPNNRFVFTFSSLPANEFALEAELHFSNESSPILAQLSGTANISRDDWFADAGLDLIIENGSVDENGRTIIIAQGTDTYQDETEQTVTESWLEVIKRVQPDDTVSGLSTFATCADNSLICDIQVNNVSASDKIRWGAWLTSPDAPLQFSEFNNENGLTNDIEDDILAFWVLAERADINSLSGTAQFEAIDTNCLEFSQCVGFADDGIVQKLTAQFDVNFNSGDITNGSLSLETSSNPNINLASANSPGDVLSTWYVEFEGSMINKEGFKRPEFQTHQLSNGTINESPTDIIGNIGGIFVRPGDTFAGGYNLGTNFGKHATGVFSMKRQP
ncbi:FecR domain-containing protein [Bermanella sp. R86510]|uniref:FecR family protein n=1 Tax=unclassified Bermanella TaxID=2627862 RepID=UPI0037C734AF